MDTDENLPTKNCPFQRKKSSFSATSKSTHPSASTQGMMQVAMFSLNTTPVESFVLNLNKNVFGKSAWPRVRFLNHFQSEEVWRF